MDEQGVLGVWQLFWGCVFQKVVQNGGFVQLEVFQGWWHRHRHQTVLREFCQGRSIILTLRLDKEQEDEVALLLILDYLEL